MSGNAVAPEAQVWVCAACGKRSRDLYGFRPVSYGWDESCMLNAVLCYESHLEFDDSGKYVRKVKDGGLVVTQRDLPLTKEREGGNGDEHESDNNADASP